MKRKMTRKEGRAYLKRWTAVNKFLTQELRSMSIKQKFADFISLMSQVPLPRLQRRLAKEDRAVLERWCLLRKILGHV